MSIEQSQFRIPKNNETISGDLVQRNEEGFVYLTAAKAVGTAAIIGLFAAGPIANMIGRSFGVELTTDLNKAKTTSESKLIELDETQELNVADAYFETKLDVQGIDQKMIASATILGKRISKSATYEYNTMLVGVGEVNFRLGFDAITPQAGEDGATDFVIDATKVGVKGHWIDGSPQFKDYTIDGNKRNFKDTTGGRAQMLKKFAGDLSLLNIDTPTNLVDELKTKTEHDINILALSTMREECPKQLEDEIEVAIEKALRANVNMLNPNEDKDGKKFGKVIFNGSMDFEVIEPPETVKKVASKSGNVTTDYHFDKPKVDTATCSAEKAAVPSAETP